MIKNMRKKYNKNEKLLVIGVIIGLILATITYVINGSDNERVNQDRGRVTQYKESISDNTQDAIIENLKEIPVKSYEIKKKVSKVEKNSESKNKDKVEIKSPITTIKRDPSLSGVNKVNDDRFFSTVIPARPLEGVDFKDMYIAGKNFTPGYYHSPSGLCVVGVFNKGGSLIYDKQFEGDYQVVVLINEGERIFNGCDLKKGLPEPRNSDKISNGQHIINVDLQPGNYVSEKNCFYVISSNNGTSSVTRGGFFKGDPVFINAGEKFTIPNINESIFFNECILTRG